jgi:hypothetical protein
MAGHVLFRASSSEQAVYYRSSRSLGSASALSDEEEPCELQHGSRARGNSMVVPEVLRLTGFMEGCVFDFSRAEFMFARTHIFSEGIPVKLILPPGARWVLNSEDFDHDDDESPLIVLHDAEGSVEIESNNDVPPIEVVSFSRDCTRAPVVTS